MMNYILKKLRMHKAIGLILFAGFFALSAGAQVKISGKVTDEKGVGISGVSVTVKKSNAGTTTNEDGTYTLSAKLKPGNNTVVFSGVGFTAKESVVSIGGGTDYTTDAVLAVNINKLDEVVVTGTSAGTTRRQLGSYIATVKADELH